MGLDLDALRKFAAVACVAASMAGFGAFAGDAAPKVEAAPSPPAEGMMKDGMTKGDVRKAAEKKQREMKAPMEKEEKALGK
jgi:hypothetical protein